MDARINIVGSLKFVFCLTFYLSSSLVRGTSDLVHSTNARIQCNPERQETVFPVVTDVEGETTDAIFSQTTPADVIFVEIEWRQRRLSLVLEKNVISSPDSVTEWEDGNTATIEAIDTACTYQGQVRGQRSTYAAITTCDGLSGYIQTNSEILFIRPSSSDDPTEDDNAHVIYTCEPEEHLADEFDMKDAVEQRRRRSARPTKYVEVQVVADHTVVNAVGSRSKATNYVLTLMNIANTAYQHNSLDQNIRVVVVKIVFLDRNQQSKVFSLRNPGQTIQKFCKWSTQTKQGQRYDVSVLLTESNFGHSGYAPVGVMCRQDQNCFAVRDEGFTSGFIIAHEMGHVFGLKHDGEDNPCKGSKYKKSIMSPVVVSTFNHFLWSECSKRSLAKLMNKYQCLSNRPTAVRNHYTLTASQQLEEDLGLSWSLDMQCRKDFGQDYEFCKVTSADPCKELLCAKKSAPRSCYTRKGIPLPGTNCADNKKCFNMECVEKTEGTGPDVVNGTWGEWGSWSDCTTGCGVGIKKRSRACNFPPNARRGQECEGDANVWTPCSDYTCKKIEDTRAEECSKWKTTRESRKWLPYELQNATLKCHQTCKGSPSGAIFYKQLTVADGTPCSYMQDNGNICFDGKCIKVGCDGELNSSKKIDACGICDGDGSLCKTITINYKKPSPSVRRYLKVLTIPAGARQITVYKSSDAYSFLALKDGNRGSYFLNGNRKYFQYAQMVHKGSMYFYSHGNRTHYEMAHTSGPLSGPVDIMVYVGRRVNELNVFYNFSMHKDDNTFEKSKFKWKFQGWSPCSVTCGRGTVQSVYGCLDKDTNRKVDDALCSVLKEPRIDKSVCSKPRCKSAPTSYKWKAADNWTQCEALCDETGTQSRIYQCQKMKGNQFVANVEDRFCKKASKADETKQCSGPVCTFKWKATESWTECEAKCGETAVQSRVYLCQKMNGNKVLAGVKDELCEGIQKDNGTKVCNGSACVFQWKAMENWTQCNAACDESGVQSRMYQCQKVDSVNIVTDDVEDELCDGIEKEDETKICDGPVCTLQWEIGNWSECSVTCGRGAQTRQIFCGNPDTDEDDFKCTEESPLFSQICTMPFCKVERPDGNPSAGGVCKNKFSLCFFYSVLEQRCKADSFRKMCCKTCSRYI